MVKLSGVFKCHLVLNTNIASLNAQRNLTTSQASLSQALQRLSSGLRINSAADDAAGLAISSQFTTQINGTNQAVTMRTTPFRKRRPPAARSDHR